jgi:hypothetical protein
MISKNDGMSLMPGDRVYVGDACRQTPDERLFELTVVGTTGSSLLLECKTPDGIRLRRIYSNEFPLYGFRLLP